MPPRLDRAAVLVVEDDRNYGPFVVRALERSGIGSTLVADGIAALKTAKRIRPRVVLLDLGLPRLHGFQVLRSLQNEARTAAARVIVMTGDPDLNRSLWNACDALRANAFYSKTWSWKLLLGYVQCELSAETPSRLDLVFTKAGISIDVPKESLVVGGREYSFHSKVCLLLFAALLDHDEPVSPERLLRLVWPRGETLGVVATTVHRLRKKLKAHGTPLTVKSFPHGYLLERVRQPRS